MEPRSRPIAFVVLALAFGCNMLGRGVGDSFMVFVLPLSDEFGWKRAEVSSVYSIYLLVTGLSAPLTGLLIDRWGPRFVYPLGLALLASACFAAGHLDRIWQFQACIGVVAGVGTSMLGMVPASILVSRWFRERMASAMGVAYAGFGTGTILLVPLAQHWIETMGWRETYFTLSLVLLAALPLLVFLPWKRISVDVGPGAARAKADGPPAVSRLTLLRQAMRDPVYWRITTLFAFTSMTTYSVTTQVVPFLIHAGLTPLEAATAFGTAGLISVLGIPAAGWIADRAGLRRTATVSIATTVVGIGALAVLVFVPARWLVLAWVVCFGSMMGARGPIVSTLAVRHFGGAGYATIYGTMFAWMSTAGALAGLASAFLFDLTGGYLAGLVFGMVTAVIAVSPFWVGPKPLGTRP